MPGPKTPIRPAPPATRALIHKVGRATPAELPDPAPYQQEVSYQLKSPEGTVTMRTREWRKAGLMQWLAACPTDVVTVPRDPGITESDPEWRLPARVYIDGYRFEIPKGEPYEVPQPIAEIIKQGQRPYVTSQAAGADLLAMQVSAARPHGKEIGAEEIGFSGVDDANDMED